MSTPLRASPAPGEPTDGLFRDIVEQWPGAVFIVNREGELRWANAAAEVWVAKPWPVGQPLVALGLPWLADASDIAAVMLGGTREYAARAATDRTGRERYCAARLVSLRRGQAQCGALFFIDEFIAEGSTVVQAPRASDAERAFAMGAAQVGVWSRNLLADEGAFDPIWCDALHIDPCAGREHAARWEKRIHPDDLSLYRARSSALQGGAEAFEAEFRVLTTGSRWLWLLQRGQVIEHDEQGRAARAAGICIEIDARKRAEVALQEKESRLATALWGARAAFWEWNLTSDTSAMSAMWFAMTGYKREDWERETHPWRSRIHPEDLERVVRQIEDHFEGRSQLLEIEYRIRTADGRWRWIQDRGRVSEWDFDGKATVAIGVSLDIEAQKQAELELRSSEARLETALWAAKIGLWEIDFASDSTQWHNDWCQQMGIEPAEGARHVERWDERIHPDDIEDVRARFATHVAGRSEHYDAEYRIRTQRGEWRWLYERSRVIERSPDGTALRMIGICMDVEERRAMELANRETQGRLEAAIEGTRICVWDWDVAAGRLYCNDMYREIVGGDRVPRTQAEHRAQWLSRLHPDDRPRVLAAEQALMGGARDDFETEYRLRAPNGGWRWMLERGRVTERNPDRWPQRISGFMVDVTGSASDREALRTSEERFRLVSELTPGYVFAYDLQEGLPPAMTYASEGFERIYGFPFGRLAETGPVEGFFEPESVQESARFRAAVLRGEQARALLRVRDVAGERRWLEVNARATRDKPSGRLTGAIGSAQDVTTRVEAEGERARAIETLNAVTGHAPDWLLLLDTQFNIRFTNRGWSAGSAEELQGRPYFDSIPEVNRDKLRGTYDRVLRTGVAEFAEVLHPLIGGGTSHLLHRVSPLHDAGRLTGLAVTVTDVTAVNRAEEQRRQSQHLVETVARATADWLVLLDGELRVLFINRPVDDRTTAELTGRRVPELGLRFSGDLSAHVNEVLENGRPRTEEYEVEWPDGSVRAFELRIHRVSGEAEPRSAVVTATEITERRAQLQNLRAQARIFETMREGVALFDMHGSIRLTNAAFNQMFGFEPGTLHGTSWYARVRRQGVAPGRLTKEERDLVIAGGTADVEFEGVRADGSTFVAACVASRIQLGADDLRLVVMNDVTERKRLEREVLEVTNREQQRMGMELHDGLGQDLTGIALMLRGVAGQLRKERSDARPDVEEIIGLVNGAIESTRTLARGLSPVNVRHGGLIVALEGLAVRLHDRHGIPIEVVTDPGLPLALPEGALDHLYRIAQEATLNALRHAQPKRVTIAVSQVVDRLCLSIEDDGRGFDPNTVHSTGMGLRIMRYRAQVLAGEITISRRAGSGTRVECVCHMELARA